ncbi:MAG: translation elongation factor 4, partial [Clostridiales bacterium]|nr:translation elongation factor 4 [Clostridiales bacterium]
MNFRYTEGYEFCLGGTGLTDQSKLRNFSIIAHIDHGKSTLADRLLEQCNAVSQREMENQLLDNMELERERGITIKARAVRLEYTAQDGQVYVLNLIDTPGHVDFNYEVSRSLAACEGAVLVVDAAQGVEAQTLANTYLAIDAGLEVLPVVNKIDLPAADPQQVKQEIEDVIGLPAMDAPEISAKNGINIPAVLEDIVRGIPAPRGDRAAPLRALIFDSQYDAYRGVIVYLRVVDGTICAGQEVRMMATGTVYRIVEVGYLHPKGMEATDALGAGEVGYFTASIKNVSDTKVGDTVTAVERPASEPLPGYREAQPMVYSGIYPADGARYPDLRDALEKLKLNDASLSFEPESSTALGFGFRCGFLGLLHMEIIQERLEREFNLDLITTAPNVVYRITKTDGSVAMIDNPADFPSPAEIELGEEPYVKASIITPPEYVGNVMDLCQERRGEYQDMTYLDASRVEVHYHMPLNEIIYDFFDALKSRTRGYASLDYEFLSYRPSKLVKLDILLNGEVVDALSFIVFEDRAYSRGRKIAEKLKENIPRQLFEIPIQAAIGGKVIARETIKALRKDVLAKCYGGDITRKKKLLEKQKEGKKRMRQFGTVAVPSEAFMAVLKLDE